MNGFEVTHTVDAVLLLFRCSLGVMIFMHGYNHLWGPGGIEGTARWFGSLGFRPAKVHAAMSGLVEIVIGPALVLGLLTPLACAALIGTMLVAWVAVHRPNGFFVIREGFEYVMIVSVAALALATVGPGTWSVDSLVGVVDYGDPFGNGLLGGDGFLIAAVGGVAGASLLLGFGWRPVRKDS